VRGILFQVIQEVSLVLECECVVRKASPSESVNESQTVKAPDAKGSRLRAF
jgi:hypothetical protein